MKKIVVCCIGLFASASFLFGNSNEDRVITSSSNPKLQAVIKSDKKDEDIKIAGTSREEKKVNIVNTVLDGNIAIKVDEPPFPFSGLLLSIEKDGRLLIQSYNPNINFKFVTFIKSCKDKESDNLIKYSNLATQDTKSSSTSKVGAEMTFYMCRISSDKPDYYKIKFTLNEYIAEPTL